MPGRGGRPRQCPGNCASGRTTEERRDEGGNNGNPIISFDLCLPFVPSMSSDFKSHPSVQYSSVLFISRTGWQYKKGVEIKISRLEMEKKERIWGESGLSRRQSYID